MTSVSRYFSATTLHEKLKPLFKILKLQLRDWSIIKCFQTFSNFHIHQEREDLSVSLLCLYFMANSFFASCVFKTKMQPFSCILLNMRVTHQLFCLSPRQHNHVIMPLRVNPPVGCQPKSTICTTNIQTWISLADLYVFLTKEIFQRHSPWLLAEWACN